MIQPLCHRGWEHRKQWPFQCWWVRVVGFSKVAATFDHVGGSFNLFLANTGDVWIIPSNMGLCAVCWAHFMCHHELWPTSVGHPFSFLSSSYGLTGGKHYQKITIAIFRFVLKKFAILGCFFLIYFYIAILSLVGLLLQSVALFQSKELVKYLEYL